MTTKISSLEGKIEIVELSNVMIDMDYQRGVKSHHKYIEKNFDRAAVGIPTVARRGDGTLWWLDGIQRSTAMMNLGIYKWKCTVLESSGAQYEAHVFRLLNDKKGRK